MKGITFLGLALILTACASVVPAPAPSLASHAAFTGKVLVCQTGQDHIFDVFYDAERVFEENGTFKGKVLYEGTKIVPFYKKCRFEKRIKNKPTSHSDWFVTQE